jgi:hypothetical protein
MFFVTEALAILRDVGTWAILQPGDFADISISKVLRFVQSLGLLDLRPRFAQKIRNGQTARVPVVPGLMYCTFVYSVICCLYIQ